MNRNTPLGNALKFRILQQTSAYSTSPNLDPTPSEEPLNLLVVAMFTHGKQLDFSKACRATSNFAVQSGCPFHSSIGPHNSRRNKQHWSSAAFGSWRFTLTTPPNAHSKGVNGLITTSFNKTKLQTHLATPNITQPPKLFGFSPLFPPLASSASAPPAASPRRAAAAAPSAKPAGPQETLRPSGKGTNEPTFAVFFLNIFSSFNFIFVFLKNGFVNLVFHVFSSYFWFYKNQREWKVKTSLLLLFCKFQRGKSC